MAIMGGLAVATLRTISFRDTAQLIAAEAVRSDRVEELIDSARAADAASSPQPHFRSAP